MATCFCMMNTAGSNKKKQRAIEYSNLQSAIRPVPHGENLPAPTPLNDWKNIDIAAPTGTDEDTNSISADEDPRDGPFHLKDETFFILQHELNDLARDLQLLKEKAEFLGAGLKEWNLLAPGTTYAQHRKRNEPFSEYYRMEDSLCVCTDINDLMNELGVQRNPSDWCLFIDSSKYSLKAVLLHNGSCLWHTLFQ